MKYVVTAPNAAYTGVSAGIHFVGGTGETDSDYLAEWFRSHGYTVNPVGGKELKRMNKAELISLAAEKGIDVPDGATNAEIVMLIEVSEGG